jgi:hypothetical protein
MLRMESNNASDARSVGVDASQAVVIHRKLELVDDIRDSIRLIVGMVM